MGCSLATSFRWSAVFSQSRSSKHVLQSAAKMFLAKRKAPQEEEYLTLP